MLGFGDLVLCAGTVMTASFEEQVEAAAAAGFAGLSAHARAALDAVGRAGSVDAVRRMLDDNGIQLADLDAVVDWIPGVGLPAILPEDQAVRCGDFLELAAALGARGVNVADLSQQDHDPGLLADAFGAVCDRGAELGLVVYLEFFAVSVIDDLAKAGAIVDRAGRPNGGILLDTWHFGRGPASNFDELARRVDQILMLQVSDAPPDTGRDWFDETMHARLLPGEGVVDLTRILAAVRDGAGSPPIGVEVFSDRMYEVGPREAARLAADATRAVLASVA